MATFYKFDQFVEDLAHQVHDLSSDAITIALTLTAPVQTNEILGNLTPIAYTNVVTTPNASRVCGTPTSSAQTSGVYKLTFADMTITATGGSIADFRYIVIYNDTPASPLNPLIGWYDYGSTLSLSIGETLLIDWDASAGTLTIT